MLLGRSKGFRFICVEAKLVTWLSVREDRSAMPQLVGGMDRGTDGMYSSPSTATRRGVGVTRTAGNVPNVIRSLEEPSSVLELPILEFAGLSSASELEQPRSWLEQELELQGMIEVRGENCTEGVVGREDLLLSGSGGVIVGELTVGNMLRSIVVGGECDTASS